MSMETIEDYRARLKKMPGDKFEEEVGRSIFLYLQFDDEFTKQRRNAVYDEAVRRQGINSPIYWQAHATAMDARKKVVKAG